MKKRKVTTIGKFLLLMHKISEGVGDSLEGYAGMAPYQMRNKILHPRWEEIKKEYQKQEKKKSFSQFVSYLKQRGYIEPVEGVSLKEGFRITRKGRFKILKDNGPNEIKKRKDSKAILLMYDIPEKKRKSREIFRKTITSLGYEILQKSVWMTERDVLKETEKTIDELKIDEYVNIFLISGIKVHK
jgi:hypothetical protein